MIRGLTKFDILLKFLIKLRLLFCICNKEDSKGARAGVQKLFQFQRKTI